MMKWFGSAHGADYERDTEHVATPVGKACGWCGEPIEASDDGMLIPIFGLDDRAPYHYECHMRGILGGVNHIRGLCHCCGGTEPPDPPELSMRAAAIAAVVLFDIMKLKAGWP